MAEPAKRWVVRVYWESTQTLDATAISLVLCRLEGNSTVINQRQVDDTWEATVTVEAPTIETAGNTTWNLVAGAGELPLGLEVLREDRVDSAPGTAAIHRPDLPGPRFAAP